MVDDPDHDDAPSTPEYFPPAAADLQGPMPEPGAEIDYEPEVHSGGEPSDPSVSVDAGDIDIGLDRSVDSGSPDSYIDCNEE